jgi:DNA polymerase V
MVLEDVPPAKREIACTRSFGQSVTQLHELTEAITEFTCRAAQKLREQNSQTNQVLVFIRTSPFRANEAQYSRSCVVPLVAPCSDSTELTRAAVQGLTKIYREGFNFRKAGIMLLDLQSAGVQQGGLDFGGEECNDKSAVMVALDGLNQRYGRGAVTLGSAATNQSLRRWDMRQMMRTPRYTTRWDELATVAA